MRYDASGQRVYRERAGEVTHYYGRYIDLSYSKSGGISRKTQYYYAGPLLIARKDASGKYWYHQDHLGSTRLITDHTGSVVARYDYNAFGTAMNMSGTGTTDIQFSGHRTDDANNLTYMNARYYDSDLGRFISADSVIPNIFNPQALNAYSYVYNNPISNIDPTGHQPEGSDPEEWTSWEEASCCPGALYGDEIVVYGVSEPPLVTVEESDETTVGELAKSGLYPTTGEYVRVSPSGMPIQSQLSNYDFGVDMFGQLARFHNFQAQGFALYWGLAETGAKIADRNTLSNAAQLSSDTITVEQAVAKGLVRQGGRLHTLLSNIQRIYFSVRPTNLGSAQEVLNAALESSALEVPPNPNAMEQLIQGYQEFTSFGGEVTRLTSSGEIIVTRGEDVLLRLTPGG